MRLTCSHFHTAKLWFPVMAVKRTGAKGDDFPTSLRCSQTDLRWSHMLQLHLKLMGKSSPLSKKVALEMMVTGDGNERKGVTLVAQW